MMMIIVHDDAAIHEIMTFIDYYAETIYDIIINAAD